MPALIIIKRAIKNDPTETHSMLWKGHKIKPKQLQWRLLEHYCFSDLQKSLTPTNVPNTTVRLQAIRDTFLCPITEFFSVAHCCSYASARLSNLVKIKSRMARQIWRLKPWTHRHIHFYLQSHYNIVIFNFYISSKYHLSLCSAPLSHYLHSLFWSVDPCKVWIVSMIAHLLALLTALCLYFQLWSRLPVCFFLVFA